MSRLIPILATVAAMAAGFVFRTQIGEALGPSCAVGVTGTAASVTVRGWTAPAACDKFKTSYTYSANTAPSTPEVCRYELEGGWPGRDLFIVHDEGALKLVGSALCEALAQQQVSPPPNPQSTARSSPPTVAKSSTSAPGSWVVAPESCGALQFGADGNASPVTCPDGRPNLAAERYFRPFGLAVMELGPYASPSDVQNAICSDWRTKPTTGPIETSAAELAYAEQDWHFGITVDGMVYGCQ